jgi:hypothetical protein
MKMQKNSKSNEKTVFLKIAAIFLAAVLSFGLFMGVYIGVRDRNAVVSYEGVGLTDGVINYLHAYYKYAYLINLAASVPTARDSEEFWQSVTESGESYGEILKRDAEIYIRELCVAVYLYDSYARLSSEVKSAIKDACREVLIYKMDNDKEKFNEAASVYGFDYSDFETATELLYKSYEAKNIIYGVGGDNLKNYPSLCAEYLEKEFSHVRLLFIRTNDKFLLDENGNRVKDEDGNDKLVPLNDDERAERLAAIQSLDDAILSLQSGGDMQISPEMFSLYQVKYGEGDESLNESGYYFADGAEYTEEFKSVFKSVVDAALSMNVGDYLKVKTDVGYCFIYKIDVESGAYADSTSGFFSDFYSDCANYSYTESLKTLASSVKISEAYQENDIITTPYNSDIIAYVGK